MLYDMTHPLWWTNYDTYAEALADAYAKGLEILHEIEVGLDGYGGK